MTMSPLTLLSLCLLLPACLAGWQNKWDKKHLFQCKDGEYVTRIKSKHHNGKEDRKWEVLCGREEGLRADRNCQWTGYVNSYDKIMTFTCPSNKVITGMSSVHNNRKEDRQFKFLCCTVYAETKVCEDGTFGSNCQFKCQCSGGQVCDKVNGTCPTGCEDGKYGPGCQLDDKCYYSDNKAHYQGRQSTTVTGNTCQKWKTNKPHTHRYYNKCEFADGDLPDNHCRTTVSENHYDPWCYTTNPAKRWEYCGVEQCDCPEGRYGEDCDKECHCGDGSCDRVTGKCSTGDCAMGWGGENCQARLSPAPTGCYITSYVNKWDKEMDFRAPAGSVVTGAISHHSNSKEDRRWKFFVCKILE